MDNYTVLLNLFLFQLIMEISRSSPQLEQESFGYNDWIIYHGDYRLNNSTLSPFQHKYFRSLTFKMPADFQDLSEPSIFVLKDVFLTVILTVMLTQPMYKRYNTRWLRPCQYLEYHLLWSQCCINHINHTYIIYQCIILNFWL